MSSHGRSLDILTKRRIRELVNSAAGPDDEVKFVLQNANGWAFVALQDRVVIARAGMAAGATFGGRISQFLCRDIINVAQNMGMMTAVIEIHTPAHQGNAVGDFWAGLTSTGGTSKSPFEADNAFPHNRAELKEWQPYLEELNGYIRQARTRGTQPPCGWARLSAGEACGAARVRGAVRRRVRSRQSPPAERLSLSSHRTSADVRGSEASVELVSRLGGR